MKRGYNNPTRKRSMRHIFQTDLNNKTSKTNDEIVWAVPFLFSFALNLSDSNRIHCECKAIEMCSYEMKNKNISIRQQWNVSFSFANQFILAATSIRSNIRYVIGHASHHTILFTKYHNAFLQNAT